MIRWEILALIIILFIPISYILYLYGKKKGISEFLNMLFIAGLMGKTEAFRNYNKYAKKGGIVFVGDSITQDFNVYEYFHGRNVYNRGIGGDTSKGVLGRLQESVFDLEPEKVFLNIGTNDLELLNDGIDGIHSRIQEIIYKIKETLPNTTLYLISVYPVNPAVDSKTVGKRKNTDISELNNRLSELEGITFIDLYSKLVDEEGLCRSYTIEGLHMNQQGYEIIKQELEQYL